MKKEIDYEKVFKMFVGADRFRPNMMQPFKQNGMYYATDAHALITMPIDKIELPFSDQSTPGVSEVMPEILYSGIALDIELLEAKINELCPLVDEYEIEAHECKECEGYGTVECDMEHEHDCRECNGGGEIDGKNPTGKKIKDKKADFYVLNQCFKQNILSKLIEASKMLNESIIYKVSGEGHRLALFNVGETKIAIMPCNTDANDPDLIKIDL